MTSKAFYSLMGLAVGDAVGAVQEFEKSTVEGKQTDMERGGPFNVDVGNWTDDTSMALVMAWSIIERQGTIDLKDHLDKYLLWVNDKYFSANRKLNDIGITFTNSLNEYTRSNQVVRDFEWTTGGNGCIMKLAPIPMLLHKFPELAITYSAYSCINTHHSTKAIDCCRYFAGLIVGAIQGASKKELTTPFFVPQGLPRNYWSINPLCTEVSEMVSNFHTKELKPYNKVLATDEEVRAYTGIFNSGYSVKSLEAALWHLKNSESFEEGVLRISNHGYDSDTVAAIFGQIAGPLYSDSFPLDWMSKLTYSPLLQFVSTTLCCMAENVEPSPDFVVYAESKSTNCTEQRIVETPEYKVKPFPLLFQTVVKDRVTAYNLLNQLQDPYFAESERENVTRKLIELAEKDVWVRELYREMLQVQVEPVNLLTEPLTPYSVFGGLINSMCRNLLTQPTTFEKLRFLKHKSYFYRVQAKPELFTSTFEPAFFYKVFKLLNLFENIVANTSCHEYFTYMLQTELDAYIDVNWMRLNQNPEPPALQETYNSISQIMNNILLVNFEKMYDNFNLYQNTLTMFQDTEGKRFFKMLLASMQPGRMLQNCVMLMNQRGTVFTDCLGQLLYTDKNFYEDTEFCETSNLELWRNTHVYFNFTKVLPLFPDDEETLVLPGYRKPFIKSNEDKYWFLNHWHFQSMHLQKMRLCKLICDKKNRLESPFKEAKKAEPLPVSPRASSTGVEEKKAEPPTAERPLPAAPVVFRREDHILTLEELKTRDDIFQSVDTMVDFLHANLPEEQGFEFENVNEGNKVLYIAIFSKEMSPTRNIPRLKGTYLNKIGFKEALDFFGIEASRDNSETTMVLKTPSQDLATLLPKGTNYDLIVILVPKQKKQKEADILYEEKAAPKDEILQMIPLLEIHNLLKKTGKLVFITDERSAKKIHSGSTQAIDGLNKNPLFCFFKTNYYFYMKTMEGSQHCYYNSTFATIPIFSVEDRSPKHIITLEPNESKLCYSVRKTPSVLECKQENIRNNNASSLILPCNYFDSEIDCVTVSKNLNKYWSTLSNIAFKLEIEIPIEPTMIPKPKPIVTLLDQYFVTTTVRGGGNCLYLAFNELLVLRNWERLSLKKLFEGVIEFSKLDNFPILLYNFQSDLVDWENSSDLKISALFDYYTGTDNKSVYWFFVIAFIYKVRIVLFKMSLTESGGREVFNCIERFTPAGEPVFKNQNGTFFILSKDKSHFYPLFPTGTYTEEIYNDFRIGKLF